MSNSTSFFPLQALKIYDCFYCILDQINTYFGSMKDYYYVFACFVFNAQIHLIFIPFFLFGMNECALFLLCETTPLVYDALLTVSSNH